MDLTSLRAQIDQIDAQLHDLIKQRAALMPQIFAAKQAGKQSFVYQPAREALVLRRLLSQHKGSPFPAESLLRIWRELMTSCIRLQIDLRVAVCKPFDQLGYVQLARDHFSADTPITLYESQQQILSALKEGTVLMGVLPMPGSEPDDPCPWWFNLWRTRLRIVFRLPFLHPTQVPNTLQALVVAPLEPEPTEEDRSIIVLEPKGIFSRTHVLDFLNQAGLPPRFLAGYRPSINDPEILLLEIPGFSPSEESRLSALVQNPAQIVANIWQLGTYAVPIEGF